MTLNIQKSSIESGLRIEITGSKSESNRALILKALYPALQIENLSNSDDTILLQKALRSTEEVIDINHAGTAMRFLTAYLACRGTRQVSLTGSKRMKERPIEILVDALRFLGAKIDYLENDGCPPLKITPSEIDKSAVGLDADVSSQYISALMLVAPSLPNGLEIYLKGKVTSQPYINMTLQMLKSLGIEGDYQNNTITIQSAAKIEDQNVFVVESDWSSASYYYSIIALSPPGTQISLGYYKLNSLQGDAALSSIYEDLRVETSFSQHTITLKKKMMPEEAKKSIKLNLADSPDIAQTIAVSCLGLGMSCDLSGLHTLKIKETDRLVALKTELEKLGAQVEITDAALKLTPTNSIRENVSIATYHDHRMAMAFAPLALQVPITIIDPGVVSKSYPGFWTDLKAIGFAIIE